MGFMGTHRNVALYLQGHFAVALAATFVLWAGAGTAAAKTPGKTYCFRGYCHRVLTIPETTAIVGHQTILSTSNYDDCKHDRFNPCGLTSSGAVFEAGRPDNAASPIYPDGTIILVRYPATGKSAVLRVNSAGPYHQKRLLDVSRATAEVLGFKRSGVANLEVRILQAPTKAEASYKARRVYPPVPGYLGQFASLDGAGTRYAALTGVTPATATVAAIYPQAADGRTTPQPSLTGNGIERTWLSRSVALRPGRFEVRQARKVAARFSRHDARTHKLQAARA